jgi:hypothetical protein
MIYSGMIVAKHDLTKDPFPPGALTLNFRSRTNDDCLDGGDGIPSIESSRVSAIECGKSSPRFPLKSRPDLVEEGGGGGFCSSEAVGARLDRME